MPTEPGKVMCWGCYWKGVEGQLLRAPDPFDEGAELEACPHCRDCSRIVPLCDEPGCALPAGNGYPTPEGYRLTCHLHSGMNSQPKKEQEHGNQN